MAGKADDEAVEVCASLRRRAQADVLPLKASAEVPLSAAASTRLLHELLARVRVLLDAPQPGPA